MAFKKNNKVAGSRKGIPNKKKFEIDSKIVESGMLPLEFLLKIMRGEIKDKVDGIEIEASLSLRADAAKAAAPYLHKKMPQENVLSGDDKKPVTFTIIMK